MRLLRNAVKTRLYTVSHFLRGLYDFIDAKGRRGQGDLLDEKNLT